jgi:hypothetical protein
MPCSGSMQGGAGSGGRPCPTPAAPPAPAPATSVAPSSPAPPLPPFPPPLKLHTGGITQSLPCLVSSDGDSLEAGRWGGQRCGGHARSSSLAVGRAPASGGPILPFSPSSPARRNRGRENHRWRREGEARWMASALPPHRRTTPAPPPHRRTASAPPPHRRHMDLAADSPRLASHLPRIEPSPPRRDETPPRSSSVAATRRRRAPPPSTQHPSLSPSSCCRRGRTREGARSWDAWAQVDGVGPGSRWI